MAADKEFERTITAGEKAIGYLKYNETPAIPRYYELWFTYAMGHNKKLTRAIKEVLAEKSKLSIDETERFYETFLSVARIPEKVGEVGAQVSAELKEVMDMIQQLAASSGQYGKSLESTVQQMSVVETPDQLKTIVATLATATHEMAKKSRDLEGRLEESREQIQELNHVLEEIRTESMTDQLTSIANRKKFDEVLAQEMVDANLTGDPLSLLLTDIDFFKKFNDKYGHQTGDQVLRLVAHTLKSSVKMRDLAARYGGEEFAVILPQTSLENAMIVAEKMRNAVRNKELYQKSTGESLGRVTLSIGVAVYHPGESKESFIERADKCLYAAKNAGRDQVKSSFEDTIAATESSKNNSSAA